MNSAHLHLIITHLPIFGSVFGFCLLVLSLAHRSLQLQQTSLWLFVLSGATTATAYLTGRPANTLLMKWIPSASLDASDQHAEIAVIALVCAALAASLAIIGLVVSRTGKREPTWLLTLLLVLGLTSSAALAWTANLGARIRHSEIQARAD
jgi:uncharacterized membrane protein